VANLTDGVIRGCRRRTTRCPPFIVRTMSASASGAPLLRPLQFCLAQIAWIFEDAPKIQIAFAFRFVRVINANLP
jgi:hypothetical protein